MVAALEEFLQLAVAGGAGGRARQPEREPDLGMLGEAVEQGADFADQPDLPVPVRRQASI